MGFVSGQQLTPTLKLVRPLAQGAMGSVWIADHLTLGAQVAVKFMSPAVAQDDELVARFRREAAASAQIKSPHIVQVFDHGVASDGSPYIVMELLEGEDLESRIERQGPLPPREAARLIRQAAKALGRAHQLGIVHRDVKPSNIFILDLDGEPFVKLLDFGIAKQRPVGNMNMTATGSMLGTPHYMSPEQFMSAKHVDHHADLWALGVVAYKALTGKLPFTGETLGVLIVAVHAGVFVRPTKLRPGLPAAVDGWMARALAGEPSRRFSSAKELAQALDQAVGSPEGNRVSLTSWGEYAAGPLADSGERGASTNEPNARTFQGMAGSTAMFAARRRPGMMAAAGLGALLLVSGVVLVATRAGSRAEPSRAEVSAATGSAAMGSTAAAAEAPVALPSSGAPHPAAPGPSGPDVTSGAAPQDATGARVEAAAPEAIRRVTPPPSGVVQAATKPTDTSAGSARTPSPAESAPVSSGSPGPQDPSTVTDTPPPQPKGAEFDRGVADVALGAAASSATKCKDPSGPIGTGTVRVTFAPSGRVTSSQVIGPPFAGTSVGGCVAVTFRGAHVPPFTGAPTSLTRSFTIN